MKPGSLKVLKIIVVMLFIGGILAGIGMFVNSTFGEADQQRTDPKNIEKGDKKGNSIFLINLNRI